MHIENQNLLMIKQHNRRIVERAFNHSHVNTTYVFQKKIQVQDNEDSNNSDNISLQSRISQTYNLHQQNYRMKNFDDQQRKIVSISKLLKTKYFSQTKQQSKDIQTKTTFFTSHQYVDRQCKTERKYLSLTPKKSISLSKLEIQSSQKKARISLTKKFNQHNLFKLNTQNKSEKKLLKDKQTENVEYSLLKDLKTFASRCFSSDNKNFSMKDKNQVFFHDTPVNLSQQHFFKKLKFPVSENTADSTPIMMNKEDQSKRKRILGVVMLSMHQDVFISPFRYN